MQWPAGLSGWPSVVSENRYPQHVMFTRTPCSERGHIFTPITLVYLYTSIQVAEEDNISPLNPATAYPKIPDNKQRSPISLISEPSTSNSATDIPSHAAFVTEQPSPRSLISEPSTSDPRHRHTVTRQLRHRTIVTTDPRSPNIRNPIPATEQAPPIPTPDVQTDNPHCM